MRNEEEKSSLLAMESIQGVCRSEMVLIGSELTDFLPAPQHGPVNSDVGQNVLRSQTTGY